jgi:hypothetical protein
MKNTLAIITLIIIFCSCTSKVIFEEPQPIFKRDLNKTPLKFRGIWSNIETPAYKIIISKDSIWEGLRVDIDLPFPLPPEAKNLKVVGDSILIKNLGIMINAEINGNNIKAKAEEKEVLYTFASEDILRSYKNYLFINKKNDDGDWNLNVLYIDKEKKLRSVYSFNKEKISEVMELTDMQIVKTASGGRNYILKPNKKEFKELMKIDIFNNEMIFTKE